MVARRRTRTRKPGAPRFKKLDALAAEAREEYGVDIVLNAAAMPGFRHVETGIFMLDMATLGGLCEGHGAMVYGWEHTGKTTTAMRVAAAAQRKHRDKAVCFVDAEGTFDPKWAETHGIDTEALYYISPESGEQAVNLVDAVMRSGECSMVIVDSLPALMPQKDIDIAAEDDTMAQRARLIAKLCGKIIAAWQSMRKQGVYTTVIFINQFRTKVGGFIVGDPRKLPGGSQPNYLVTTKIETKNKEVLGRDERDNEIVAYNQHSFVITKGKFGNSMRKGEYQMIRDPSHSLGAGAIDECEQVLTYAKRNGLVYGGGKRWEIVGINRPFPNKMAMTRHLLDNEEDMLLLKRLVIMEHRQRMGVAPVPPDGWLLGEVDAKTKKTYDDWIASLT